MTWPWWPAAAAAPRPRARSPSPRSTRSPPTSTPSPCRRLPVDADPPLGRPVVRRPRRRSIPSRPDARGPGAPVRLQQRLPRHPGHDRRGRTALLCCNHEYTNRPIMFPPTIARRRGAPRCSRTLMAAHGFSVVELRAARPRQPVALRPGRRRNRRITANTPFRLTGPAAGQRPGQDRRRPDRAPGRSAPSATAPAAPPRGGPSCPARRTSRPTSSPTGTARGQQRYGLTDATAPSVYGCELDRCPLRRPKRRLCQRAATGSATSSRSTRTIRPRPRASTRRWAGSSTRARTSGSDRRRHRGGVHGR